jgi:hypothetical protein
LRNRRRWAKQRKQLNPVGPKQRGAGGRVREGREPRVGEPVGFCDANLDYVLQLPSQVFTKVRKCVAVAVTENLFYLYQHRSLS